ncbi:MAG: hypothetical protein GWP15_02420 [Nitrospirae bacterium]|nr:hypothetical protein [Nitrospirota bacterium]
MESRKTTGQERLLSGLHSNAPERDTVLIVDPKDRIMSSMRVLLNQVLPGFKVKRMPDIQENSDPFENVAMIVDVSGSDGDPEIDASRIPTIMQSAVPFDKEENERVLKIWQQGGVDAAIKNPVTIDDLRDAIASAINIKLTK